MIHRGRITNEERNWKRINLERKGRRIRKGWAMITILGTIGRNCILEFQ